MGNHYVSYTISIIICTRNRALDLRATLASLAQLDVPAGMCAELLVVDNGSQDQTAEVLRSLAGRCGKLSLRSLFVAEPGKARSLNHALASATGDVLLFTDDDVHPPTDWIDAISGPIRDGTADAVAGGIRLAPSLRRPWLAAAQRSWLASTEDLPKGIDHPLIGANMAVARQVFQRVPCFDPEVGPGALGHAEDTLFWLQVRQAGFRIATRLDIEVEHHLEPDRLSRKSFARQARKRGEFAAYVEHHWEHYRRRWPRLAFYRAALRLARVRVRHFPGWIAAPTMPAWELEPLEKYHARRCFLRERCREPNYECHGLARRDWSGSGSGTHPGDSALTPQPRSTLRPAQPDGVGGPVPGGMINSRMLKR